MYASKFGIFAPTAKIPLADYFSISDKIFHNWNNKFYSINGFFLVSSCSDIEEIYKQSTSGISLHMKYSKAGVFCNIFTLI